MSNGSRLKNKAMRALKSVFGFESLRPFQDSVVSAVFEGKDVIAISSTGSGKSLVFQLPSLVLPGLTVVISPLIALMTDHVDKLTALGIAAARLTADQGDANDRVMSSLNKYRIVYISPEKAKTAEFRKALRRVEVSLFAVDESHMISAASGYRPSYAALSGIISEHPDAVRLACTATADSVIEEDILRVLQLRNPVRFVSSPWRDNISWRFVHDAKHEHMINTVKKAHREPGSQVVYVASRNESEKVAGALEDEGVSCHFYHAGMESSVRERILRSYINHEVRCIVATSAFGMGVDVPDIRLVLVWQLPANLFELAQMVGRASRDGKPAVGWVRTGNKAERSQRFFIDTSNPSLSMYERLWKKFSRDSKGATWSSEALMKIAGISDDTWRGQLSAAMSLLEFTGHISTAPAGIVYRAPVLHPSKAERLVRALGGYVKNEVAVYPVPPGSEDRSQILFTSGACERVPADEATHVRPLLQSFKITQAMLDDKLNRALRGLEQIDEFSVASDKKAYMESQFLS